MLHYVYNILVVGWCVRNYFCQIFARYKIAEEFENVCCVLQWAVRQWFHYLSTRDQIYLLFLYVVQVRACNL
jgi:hypothetical protein